MFDIAAVHPFGTNYCAGLLVLAYSFVTIYKFRHLITQDRTGDVSNLSLV